MKNKKLLFLLFSVLIITIIVIFIVVKNFISIEAKDINQISEYTPEEEISPEQMKQAIVNLYYINTLNNELKNEGHLIDSIKLLENPYKELISLLISGPDNSELTNPIPLGTQILDANLQNSCVTLNFNQEITNFSSEEQKFNIINCILNTLSQLNEVNSVKFLVNNEYTPKFRDEYFRTK